METDKANVRLDGPLSSPLVSPDNANRVAQFWQKYSKEADDYDTSFLRKNGDNIDVVLIFAGLFSAVSAAFLVATQVNLSPAPTDTTNALLMMLVHSNNNTAFADQDLELPSWDGPSPAIVCSQVLGYAALSASLLAALGAVLGKQWLSDFTRQQNGTLQDRGRRRQVKLDGLREWQFEVFMGALATLIQLALLLFSISLSISLWEVHPGVASMVIAATSIGVLLYLYITVASLLSPGCPFHTPVSSTIQGAIEIVMKSVEEVASYWAWQASKRLNKSPEISGGSKVLAYMITAVLSPLLFLAAAILLTVLAIFGPLLVFVVWVQDGKGVLKATMDPYYSALQSQSVKSNLRKFLRRVRESARTAREHIRTAYLDPEPDPNSSDARSIAWILKTSSDPDSLMAAAELVPDITWPPKFDISPLAEHLWATFVRSIAERELTGNRAVRLGQAFIIMLCQADTVGRSHDWRLALQHLVEESKNLDPDVDFDLLFILTLSAKLLSHKLVLDDHEVQKMPRSSKVSQSMLTWLLTQLSTLLTLKGPHKSMFLPEARQVFLELKWPEEPELKDMEEVEYCQTFEVFFNIVVGTSPKEIDEEDEENEMELHRPRESQTSSLRRTLKRLIQFHPSQLPDMHKDLIAPVKVLSRLASISYLKEAFHDDIIRPWVSTTFKEAIKTADESGEHMWAFASSLMNLATVVDAFNPIEAKDEKSLSRRYYPEQTPMLPLRMDSKSLLSYLLNKTTVPTPEHAVYAFKIMLANSDEIPELVSNPDFVTYMLRATDPKPVTSDRDIGLEVLVVACQHLFHAHDTRSLTALAAECDLASFLHRAILHQEQPVMLMDILQSSDEEFNACVLGILRPVLGDPLSVILTKLREEPNKIPEGDLQNLEIGLVLSKHEDRKRLLYDYLDNSIAQMHPEDYKYATARRLTVIVGWLLRQDGPLIASKDVWKALLRPNFEELLTRAWGDLDALEDNPQMLQPLLDCTARWLSTYPNPGPELLQGSPPSATLGQLDHALEQLGHRSRTFSSDTKKELHKVTREVKQRIHE